MIRKILLVTITTAIVAILGLIVLPGHTQAQGPTATITAPASGTTVGSRVLITGTAAGPNFAFYLVQFKLADQWMLVDGTVHTTPVTGTATLATWDSTKYPDGSYDFRLLVADQSGQFITGTVSVKVDNTKTPKAVVPPPNRGCTACHTQIAPDGRYTLAFEAMNADSKHPTLPNGFNSTLQDCLLCHASKQDNTDAGVVAPISMRAIVHPVHMFSDIFKEEYSGNCFSCHDVDNSGKFKVLPTKVPDDAHGIPTGP